MARIWGVLRCPKCDGPLILSARVYCRNNCGWKP